MFRILVLTLFALAALAGGANTTADSGVVHFDAAKVAAGFAKGMPLIETSTYKVHASRREGPGVVEVHTKDIDVFYVLEGSATVVTGGKMIGGKKIAEDEYRGTDVQNGQVRQVKKGDVVVVPNGVPHWFKEVKGPMTYFAVKVPAGGSK